MAGQNFIINKHRLENALPGKNGENHSDNEFSQFIYSCCQTEQNRRFEINERKKCS